MKVAPQEGMIRRLSPALILLSCAVGGTVAFSLLSSQVKNHSTAHFDGDVRRRFPKRRRRRTRKAANLIGPLGKEWVHAPLAAIAALVLWSRGRRAAAAAVMASSVASTGLSHVFEAAITQRNPPKGRHKPSEPSFPSGHSLETMAVSLTIAYVLTREDVVDGRVAMPIAIAVPLISGIGRVYLDRHWATDVLGGWLAGTSVAATAAAAYEAAAD